VSYALFLHPSAFIHPLWFNHSSFIITIILHQLDDIRLPTLNLPAINLLSRPMYFSFSRTFFFTPFPFSFFCYNIGGPVRKYLYFAISVICFFCWGGAVCVYVW